ncbi:MAG TPA: hypothetical protein VKY65_15285 [Alphaproteobacteria bacterium]|nr:hypothetical protein [Alphaproteobacteria bacterium]
MPKQTTSGFAGRPNSVRSGLGRRVVADVEQGHFAMRETRAFMAAFAAALASVLGMGTTAAAGSNSAPQDYHADAATGAVLPTWLVRFKLRQLGYQDLGDIVDMADGFAVEARDRWGRRVRLFVDARRGEIVPRRGYGLAHLRAADLPAHLDALGYRCLGVLAYRDGCYRAVAQDPAGCELQVNIDAYTGAVWT